MVAGMDEDEITHWDEDDSPESLVGEDAADDWASEFELAWVLDEAEVGELGVDI
jgi:hypothetical protein